MQKYIYSRIRDLREDKDLTQEELAKRLGKSRSHITNMLGLLNLPDEVQKSLGNKEISMGHARIISKLENKEQQISLAKKVSDDELSVRQLEELTKSNLCVSTITSNVFSFIFEIASFPFINTF